MRKRLTAEQAARHEAKREKFKELCRKFAAMPAAEREKWAQEAGVVVTIEGHALSPRNTVLCYFQRAGVSMVGGFRQWIRAGRCVKKGEHGMSILVPVGTGKKRGDAENDDAQGDDDTGGGVHFIAGTVFDISQTAEIDTDAGDDTNCEKTANNMQLQLI